MKKNVSTLIFLITLLTGILPVFATTQHLLAPSVKQHMSTFPEEVVHLFNKAGLDDEFVNQSSQPRFALPLAPNPTTGMVKIGLEETFAVQLFDATGQMISRQVLQPGQMMDLGYLPAGIYQLVAQNETGYYRGRIVKL